MVKFRKGYGSMANKLINQIHIIGRMVIDESVRAGMVVVMVKVPITFLMADA